MNPKALAARLVTICEERHSGYVTHHVELAGRSLYRDGEKSVAESTAAGIRSDIVKAMEAMPGDKDAPEYLLALVSAQYLIACRHFAETENKLWDWMHNSGWPDSRKYHAATLDAMMKDVDSARAAFNEARAKLEACKSVPSDPASPA